MPLTADRKTVERSGEFLYMPVAADTQIFLGALVAMDASGNIVPGSATIANVTMGMATQHVDNRTSAPSGGAAGAESVRIKRFGAFRWLNSAAADEVLITNRGDNCFVVDDETVALTDNGGARPIAGRVVDVDADGVWVDSSLAT